MTRFSPREESLVAERTDNGLGDVISSPGWARSVAIVIDRTEGERGAGVDVERFKTSELEDAVSIR